MAITICSGLFSFEGGPEESNRVDARQFTIGLTTSETKQSRGFMGKLSNFSDLVSCRHVIDFSDALLTWMHRSN